MRRITLFAASPLLWLLWLPLVVVAGRLTDLDRPVSLEPLYGLQVDFGRDSDRASACLPALGEEQPMGANRENQQTTKNDWGKALSVDIADILMAAGDRLNSNHGQTVLAALAKQTRRRVKKRLSSKAAAAAESWLGQFGQARVSCGVAVEEGLQWRGDYSQPFHQSETSIWLMELGGCYGDNGYLVDAGLVGRYGSKGGQVLGMNAFVDQDFNGSYTRGSVGLEWITSWSGLYFNAYVPLSGWNKNNSVLPEESVETDIFSEVGPARGIDVNLQGIMPFYRALTFSANYAYWFGNHVDVGGREGENWAFPSTRVLTMAWQPIQLLKISFSQMFISGKQRDSRIQASLHLDLGQPLRNLFRVTDSIMSDKELSRFVRQGFSHRNTDMMLAYRKDEPGASDRPILSVPYAFDKEFQGEGAVKNFLNDPEGNYLAELLKRYNSIKIHVPDSVWISRFRLPDGQGFRNKVVVLITEHGWPTWVHYSGKKRVLADRSRPYILKNIDGVWHSSGTVAKEMVND